MYRVRTFIDDVSPERLDEGRVVMTGAVHDGQLTFGEAQRVSELAVQLRAKTESSQHTEHTTHLAHNTDN